MKKMTFLTIVGTVLICGLFFGCALFEPPEINKNETAKIGDSTDLDRKEELALKYLQEPLVSEDTLASFVMDFLDATASETGRSIQASPMVTITKTTKITHSVETGFAEKPADQRSAGSTVGPGEIPFYVFTLEDHASGKTGFALTCGDMRIGNVLAVVEQGNYDDDNPGLAVFYSQLGAYIEETVEVYNGITQADVNNAIQRNEARHSGTPVTDVGTYAVLNAHGDLNDDSINHDKNLLETQWHQGKPYNNFINGIKGAPKGYSYLTGCGPVAVAQVMAFHGKNRQDAGKGSLQGYDWNFMIYGKNKQADETIAFLMYEIGIKAGSIYLKMENSKGKGGATATTRYGVRKAFERMGFQDTAKFKNYSLSDVRASIRKGCPVIADGSTTGFEIFGLAVSTPIGGHYWIIDGYRRMESKVKINKSKPAVIELIDYVHCNMGWEEGSCNGWYKSGLFKTNKIPWEDDPYKPFPRTATEDGFYQYGLGILTGVKL